MVSGVFDFVGINTNGVSVIEIKIDFCGRTLVEPRFPGPLSTTLRLVTGRPGRRDVIGRKETNNKVHNLEEVKNTLFKPACYWRNSVKV